MRCVLCLPAPLMLALSLAFPLAAATDPARLCEAASDAAAAAEGVPPAILRALTLTETGRKVGRTLRPWPWAVNQGGKSYWFETKAEALAYAETQIAAGVRNLDIGCFQLNLRWHGEDFSDAAAMFDPETNARQAATFLRRLRDETGDWIAAAAAYHSRTEAPARRYRTRFETVLAELTGQTPAFAARSDAGFSGADAPGAAPTEAGFRLSQDAPGLNLFPLLQTGRRGNGGSLVPRSSGRTPLIGG